jgi:hypothetical protein|tara:strand:- start:7772 stop:8233 length:462 start_codon:yes stop_codon:yes gene_type:complete
MTWRLADTDSVLQVAKDLRQGDVDEGMAMYGVDARIYLPIAYQPKSTWVLSTVKSGDFGLAGVSATGTEGVGQIWMVSTDAIYDNRMEFLRGTKVFVEEMHNQYPILFNWIDARQKDHLKWLQWAGFRAIAHHERFGASGIPFVTMTRIRQCV